LHALVMGATIVVSPTVHWSVDAWQRLARKCLSPDFSVIRGDALGGDLAMKPCEVDLVAIFAENHRCIGTIDDPARKELDHHQIIRPHNSHSGSGSREWPGNGSLNRRSLKRVGHEQYVKLEGHQRFSRLKSELCDSLAVDHAEGRRVTGVEAGGEKRVYDLGETMLIDGDQHVGVASVAGMLPSGESETTDDGLGCIDFPEGVPPRTQRCKNALTRHGRALLDDSPSTFAPSPGLTRPNADLTIARRPGGPPIPRQDA
jgi:hypothetical protein